MSTPADNLWYHSIRYLEKYRLDYNRHGIQEFYDFPDETGILSRHEQLFRKEYEKGAIELKHMYFELVKLFFERERKLYPKAHEHLRDVYKIQGYQDLTNRLQSTMNNNIFMNIEELSDKVDGLVKSDKNAILAEKVVFLEKENEFLRDEYTRIEKSYQLLSDRLDAKDETDSTNILLITQQMRELQEAVEIMRKDTKLEREMTDRFEALEKADDFLRENQTQHAIKLEGINGDCKRVTTEVNEVIKFTNTEFSKVNTNFENLMETELPKLAQNCNNNIQIIRNEAEIMNNEIKSMKPKIDLNTENIQGISRVLSPMEDEVSVLSKGLNINVLPNLSSINTGLDKVIHTVNAHEGQLEKMEIETKSSLKNTTTKIEEIMTEFNYGNRINALEMEVNRNHAEKLDRIENEIAPRITKLDNELRPKIQNVEIMIKDIDSKLRSNIDEIQVKVNNQLESERIEGVKRMEPKFNDMTKIVNDNFAKLELEIHEKLWPYIKEMDHDYKAELKEKVWPSVEGIIADINLKMSKMEENHINLSKEFNIQLVDLQNRTQKDVADNLINKLNDVQDKIYKDMNDITKQTNEFQLKYANELNDSMWPRIEKLDKRIFELGGDVQQQINLQISNYQSETTTNIMNEVMIIINEFKNEINPKHKDLEKRVANNEVELFEKLWPFVKDLDREMSTKVSPFMKTTVENVESLHTNLNKCNEEIFNNVWPFIKNINKESSEQLSISINNLEKKYDNEIFDNLWPFVKEMDKDFKIELGEKMWPQINSLENKITELNPKIENQNEIVQTILPKLETINSEVDRKISHSINLFKTENNTEIQNKIQLNLTQYSEKQNSEVNDKLWDKINEVESKTLNSEVEIFEKLWPFIQSMDSDVKEELADKIWPEINNCKELQIKISEVENKTSLYQQDANKEFDSKLLKMENEMKDQINININNFRLENNIEIDKKIEINLENYNRDQSSNVTDKIWERLEELQISSHDNNIELHEKLWPYILEMDKDIKIEMGEKLWPEVNKIKDVEPKIERINSKIQSIEPRIDEVDSKANHTEKEVYNQLLPKMNNIDSEIDRKISVNINNFKTENNTDITNKILLSLKEYKKEQESEVNNKIWEKITEIQAELYEKLWPYVQEMDKDNKVEMTERLWPELNKVKKIEAQLQEITPKIKDVEDRALTSQNEIVERVIPKLNTIDSEIDRKISVNINNFKTENNTDITNKILLSLNDYKKEQDSEVNEKIWERLTEIQAELYDKLWPYVQEMDKDHKIEITERLWPELNKVKDIEVQLKEITPKIKDVEDRALTSQNEIVERVIPKLNTIDSEIDKKISVNINNFKTENNTDITNKILLSLNDYKKEQDSEVNEKIWERLTEIQAELYDKLWPYVQEMDKDNKIEITERLWPELNKVKNIEVQLREMTPKIKDVEDRALTSQNDIVDKLLPQLNKLKDIEAQLQKSHPRSRMWKTEL
ncbi:uncharacterized protein [Lepeophtheirus salmonis]|nr:uncharacterized protein PF11_0213-like [Lepeophtheirus salmonis]